jgi:DNA repair protein RecN (Recombination protein N)
LLKHLYIKNYALIDELEIEFRPGFSVVTGETGAGKSVLMGALSLILGNRVDGGVLKDKETKCVVEARFDIQRFSLKLFFDDNDIDYDEVTVIRREILPGGKSRAFVNDTPVNLNVLKDLSVQLTDIHSQHHNLNLNDNHFQLRVLDAFARLFPRVDEYSKVWREFIKLKRELQILTERSLKEKSDLEYLQHLFNELDEAKLKENEQEGLESELKQLLHTEEIKQNLSSAFLSLSDEQSGALIKLKEAGSDLRQISGFYEKAIKLQERIDSVKIEVDDIVTELETHKEKIEYDPERLTGIKERLDVIYALQNKHKVSSINDLIKIKEDLDHKLSEITSYDDQISAIDKQLKLVEEKLVALSGELTKSRVEASKKLEEKIVEIIQKLGMPSGNYKVLIEQTEAYTETGKDMVSFLFTANKHIEPQEISKIASGGEISRLMLAVKSVIADSVALPAIIFDEIDTGVSGDIADKIGSMMNEMSQNMQVISITHLPQVAAKADSHYKVFKIENEYTTSIQIKELSRSERVNELAVMLSGETVTDAAIKNAQELLRVIKL